MAAMLLLTALSGCEPAYITAIWQHDADKARAATASLAEPVPPPQQRYRHCLDIEKRAIVGNLAIPPERAADIIVDDCSPYEGGLMPNATLREIVQFRVKTGCR
jgi:hypothetical protein